MPERGIAALGRFARVVSDAAAVSDVLRLLADALYEHVAPDGVAVFALGADGKLRLAAERGLGPEVAIEVDIDDMVLLPDRVRTALGPSFVSHLNRPLVAGASLYGDVVLLVKTAGAEPKLNLAEGLIDLAALALGNAAHVEQLERQAAELEQQQQLLARTERLRALGQMAAGVSHDLGNILNPLSLHLQIIGRALERGKLDEAKESTVEMKGVLERGVQTLERLRKFSRQPDGAGPDDADLDKLVREAVAIGKARAASTGGKLPKIVDELGAPPTVKAVSAELVTAFVNLIVNAVDARASIITLRSGTTDTGVWIEIADNGPGMPPDVSARVFEPFFTTKGEEGTGLGLAMVHATMTRHGGTIAVDSEVGRGTTFRLTFPSAGPPSRRS